MSFSRLGLLSRSISLLTRNIPATWVRLILSVVFFAAVLFSLPVHLKHDGANAQSSGRRRTQGSPSRNLPNLDETRGIEPGTPRIMPPVPATKCRGRDEKCKRAKGKISNNLPENQDRLLADASHRSRRDYVGWLKTGIPALSMLAYMAYWPARMISDFPNIPYLDDRVLSAESVVKGDNPRREIHGGGASKGSRKEYGYRSRRSLTPVVAQSGGAVTVTPHAYQSPDPGQGGEEVNSPSITGHESTTSSVTIWNNGWGSQSKTCLWSAFQNVPGVKTRVTLKFDWSINASVFAQIGEQEYQSGYATAEALLTVSVSVDGGSNWLSGTGQSAYTTVMDQGNNSDSLNTSGSESINLPNPGSIDITQIRVRDWIFSQAQTSTVVPFGTYATASSTVTISNIRLEVETVNCFATVQGNRWKGEYFNNTNLSGSPALVRDDGAGALDFNWGGGGLGSPCIPSVDNFSARWTRTVDFPEAGTYRFTVTGDDGVRLYVGTQLVINKWFDQGATTYTADVPLTAGPHAVKLEYFESGGGAVAHLSWAIVCQTTVAANRWKGEYFNNTSLAGSPAIVRDDGTGFLDKNFEGGSPSVACGLSADNFSARWTQTVNFAATGTYRFIATVDNGVRLYVDGQLKINQWVDLPPNTYTADVGLIAGDHVITLEFVEYAGWASASLSWAPVAVGDLNMALIDPVNRIGSPGEDLLSRNYNWSLSLLSLRGRAGMDLGLALSLNSLVYTRTGLVVHFDPDQGYPAPGFRLGFPEIRNAFTNTDAGAQSYLLSMPSGRRVEFRQINTNVYEAVDSSYMLLTHDPVNMVFVLYTTDGTQCRFVDVTGLGDYKCVQIKDRQGNYITIGYGSLAEIRTVTDTTGRPINFNYDASNHLLSITQNWGGQTHTWATFAYGTQTIQTNFAGMALNGTANGTPESVLLRVGLADGSVYSFEYNTYAQVKTIRRWAPNNSNPVNFPGDYFQRAYTTYGLPDNASNPQTDCPRITSRTDWAYDWNPGPPSVYTAGPDWGQVKFSDDTIYKEFFATTGWQRGLTTLTENWSGGVRKKWTTLQWTQDNTGVSYKLNPRVTETIVHDDANNRRRTEIIYTSFGLVSEVREYDADTTTLLRSTQTEYNLSSVYTSRRIIGLPSKRFLRDGSNNLFSKVTYVYDLNPNPNPYLQHPGPTTQHDTDNYGPGFVQGRGNLNRTLRWDVTDEDDELQTSKNEIGYNTSGSVIFTRDPLNHETTVSYTDSFSDGQNRNTYAYPTMTTINDPGEISTTVQYNYYFGAVTRTQDPKEAVVTLTYDASRRILRTTNMVNGAYTHYVYSPDQRQVETFTTINDLNPANEFRTVRVFDGHDRVKATLSDHPGSVGQYKAQYNIYDVMGRLAQQSNPTEVNSSWEPVGDDEAGWAWSRQSYDWQGLPTVSTNQDETSRAISYEGCGCAGGQKVVSIDEVGRRREQNFDILGRMWRERTYNWVGSNETGIYTTTTNTYNVRDQVTNINVTDNASDAQQNTVMTYDGHGRLKEKWLPIFLGNPQSATPYMSYEYYDDDTLKKATDPRGASSTQVYNNRQLVTSITYAVPSGVAATPNVTFTYDEAGNRTMMDDGPGMVTYTYDTLSRLTNETRVFDNISRYHYQGSGQPYQNTFSIGYQYNLAGGLKQIQTPTGDTIDYTLDKTGMVTKVSGTPRDGVTDYVTDIKYRAWGAAKRVSFGYSNYSIDAQFNGRMLISRIEDQSSFGVTYNYNPDGKVSAIEGIYTRTLDRYFNYDHVGRVIQTRSASDAGLGSAEPPQLKQDYVHDAFNHMTSRSGEYWYTNESAFTANYINDRGTNVVDAGREQNWQYDVAGNINNFLVEGGWMERHDRDAANRMAMKSKLGPITGELVSIRDFDYDGDGNLVSEGEEGVYNGGTAGYYVRSTVLSKSLLNISIRWFFNGSQYVIGREQLLNGQWRDLTERDLSIYAGGEEIATRTYDAIQLLESNKVVWQHRDPHNTIAKIGNASGSLLYSVDPLGVLVKTAAQSEVDAYWNPPGGGDPNPSEGFYSDQSGQSSPFGFGSPFPGNWGIGCYVDKVQVQCERAFRYTSNEKGRIDKGPIGSINVPGFSIREVQAHKTKVEERPDGMWIIGTTEYNYGIVTSGLFSFGQGGATFGKITPNIGAWVTINPGLRHTFEQAFKDIQTEDCRKFVDSILQKMGSHNFVTKKKNDFEDLLRKQTYHLYNPWESTAQKAGTWEPRGSGYTQLATDANMDGATVDAAMKGVGSNIAMTIDKNTYLNSREAFRNEVDPRVLIVHEILHAGGIRTRPGYWLFKGGGAGINAVYTPPIDPISGLEGEIKKHCTP